jgi:hypothetical protein
VKASLKLRSKYSHLTIAAGVVFALSQLSAPAADAPATTSVPAPSGTAATTPASSAPTTTTTSAAATQAAVDEGLNTMPPDYVNWVTLGGGDVFVNGNSGQYKHEHNTNSGPFGGVEDFHWQTFAGKDATFTMDGHGVFGNHDYDLKLDLTDEKLGYIRAGFKEYRTWYDPSGGYYPLTGLSFQPSSTDLFVDRRNAWIEAGLTIPNWPVLVVRYEYDSREGQMDSTSWGQTTLLTPGATQAKIVPTFQGIDETRHIFSASASDKFGDTSAALGVRYEIDRTDDTTFINQNPAQPTSAFITQQDLEKNDLFSVNGSTETFFDKKLTLSSGFAVTTINTDLGGSRIYGPYYNALLSRTYPNNGSGFIGLGGGGSTKEYTGDLNAMITPIDNLVIVPSARIEYQDSNLSDNFNPTSGVGGAFAAPFTTANTNNWELDLTQNLEARYTGFRDWSLYNSAEISEDWGNNSWNSAPVQNQVNFNQDFAMLGLKYTLGANWYPLSQLNFGFQYYHQLHDYDYTNRLNQSLVQYPGYIRKQNFTTDDGNFRATWQALSTVSLVTRYDFQFSTVDTWGIPNGGTQVGGVESSTLINHILGEDVNWTPLPCLYLQVGGSYVLNTLETPVAGSAGINNLVENGQNDYWTIDASLGYEINSKTHLQLQYDYYNADNYYVNQSAADSIPYGAGDVENSITATLTRQISKEVQVSVKYGYYQNRDLTSGGQNNYDAQLVYVSTTFGF